MSLFQDNVVCQEKNQRSKEKESVFSSLAVGLVEKMRVGNAHSIRIFSQKSLFCSVTIEVAKKVDSILVSKTHWPYRNPVALNQKE